MPKVDITTIRTQRNADGSYRVSWVPLYDSSRTWYYRLRLNDGAGNPVYVGRRKMDNYDIIPAMSDGSYQLRIEAHEAQSYDLTFNRSNGDYLPLTFSASDYDPQIATITNAAVFNRTDGSAGSLATEAVIYFNTMGTSVTLLELNGPSGLYTFDLTADVNSSNSFYKDFTTPLTAGNYIFHAVINGRDHYAKAVLTTPAPFPSVDTATMQAEYTDAAKTMVQFSWAPVNSTKMLYYRITVKNVTTNSTVYQPAAFNGNSMTVSTSVIGDPSNLKWRVDAFDSISLNTRRNHHASSVIPLVVKPYSGGLMIGSGRVMSKTDSVGFTGTLFSQNAILPAGTTLSEVKITGPDAITRDLLKERWYSGLYGGTYLHYETSKSPAGLYTFSVADSSGNRLTRYKYLPADQPVPAVDSRSVKINRENSGIRISWAPVLSDLPIVYRLTVYARNDLNGDGVMDRVYSATTAIDLNNDNTAETTTILPVSSVMLPFEALSSPSPLMISINADDAHGGYLVNNTGTATIFKYQGYDYDYSTIVDADGDGYAADVDPNDTDPAVYPFSPDIIPDLPVASAVPAGGMYNSNQSVTLTASKSGAIYYTLDGTLPTYPASGSTLVYAAPIAVSKDTTIRFFAVDANGVAGGERTAVYTIDAARPTTVAVPAGGIYSAATQVRLTSNKPGSIYFTQDGSNPVYPPAPNGSTRVYIGPVTMPLNGTSGTLKYFARDLAGNLESVQSQTYTVDTTALSVSANPAGGLYNGAISVNLTATRNAAVYYTVDGTTPICGGGGTESLYTLPVQLSEAATISYIACDGVNQTAVVSESYIFDNVTPNIVNYYPGYGASALPLETVITINFDKAMNGATIPAPSRILRIGNQFIPATGGLDVSGTTLNIVPSSPLVFGTTYSVVLDSAKDLAGNALVPFSSSFTTVSQSATAVVPVVTLDTSAKSVISGNDVTATGIVTAGSTSMASRDLLLVVTRPDGGVEPLSLTTDSNGIYTSSLKNTLVQPGRYQIQAFLGDGGELAPVSSPMITVTVLPVAGYAIIAQGSVPSSEGAVSYEKTLYRAKQSLLARGFAEENILVLDSTQPKIFSKLELMFAITDWAKTKLLTQAAPLHIILADHGDVDKFFLDDEVLTPTELADWITDLENSIDAAALAQPRYIIMGSCYSGTFIPELAKAGRIIITSTSADEQSFRGPAEPDGIRSGEYFLDQYFGFLKQGQSVRDAFNNAVESISEYSRRGGTVSAGTDISLQTPLFSIDGDTKGAVQVSAGVEDNAPNTLYLGTGLDEAFNPANLVPVERSEAISSLFIESSATAADITMAGVAGQKAWFEIRKPSATSSGVPEADSKQLLVDLPTTDMVETSSGIYKGTYSGLTESGTWTVIAHLQDAADNKSEVFSRNITLYKKRSGNTVPAAPVLEYPEDMSTQRTALALSWGKSLDPDKDAVTYTVLISRNPDMSNPSLVREGINDTFLVIKYEDGLLDLGNYYWQVKAVDSYGGLSASAIRTFSTDNTNGGIAFLTGTVSDSGTAATVSDANVTVGVYSVKSLVNGKYLIAIQPGSFNVSFSATGYDTTTLRGLSAVPMKAATRNIALVPTAAASYKITATYDVAKGYLDCPVTVSAGIAGVCTLQTKPGYQLTSVEGCGGTLAGTSYSTAAASADCTVTATFNELVAAKPGDCDNRGGVTIAEVQSAINMFLGLKTVEACVDTDGLNGVSIAEVQKTINSFLGL
ncbi:MAG: chitobiase/beta-hexosaminidase C-terminal domain-containing protein [Desulfuromonadaceae bacterium]|nr:chitobiase/beta-hexosaminidase C-terminal domain-containing protein [Desulfuromonadaceae bacterium]